MSDDLALRVRNLRETFAAGDIDAAAYERGLSRLREGYGAAAIDALLDQPTPMPSGVAVTVATNSGSIAHTPISVINRADQVIFPNLPDPDAKRRDDDLLVYLRRVFHEGNALSLDRIDQTDAAYVRPITLTQVYIALNTTDQIDERADDAQRRRPTQRPISAIEAFARANNGRMVLLGAPGSGKSTFVSYVAMCLAGAKLKALGQEGAYDGLEQLAGWPFGALLPVPIVLRDLAAFPALAQASKGNVGVLNRFLDDRAAELGCPHAAEVLRAALCEGRAVLSFDGFDEVIGETVLPRVAELIRDAAKTFPGPLLVTCRVLDYQEERLRQLPGFATYTLADLDDAQIAAFVAAWYHELAASGRRSAPHAAAAAHEMQRAISSRAELRTLAATPLLLTLMAQVHAFRGTLPDARALLYDACIDLLLLRWRQPRDEPDLIARLGLAHFRSSDLLKLMARLGFEAHERAARDADTRGPADLDEMTLMALLAEIFKTYGDKRKYELAETVLHALAFGNGVLLKRGPQRYTFAHRTFQEFLAGYHLKIQPNAQHLCRTRATHLHWHEALLLMAGYQVLGENELEKPIALAERLLGGGPLEQALAGELLVLVGYERARSFDPSLVEADGLWPKAVRLLRAVQSGEHTPTAPAALRARIGLALGRLCYGELKDGAQPEACPPLPDPRLPFAMLGTPHQRSDDWRRSLEAYWCPIDAGPFWSGDDRDEHLTHATIHTPYRIARYPVTNADFARFVAANGPGGYDPDQPWWTEHGRIYLRPGGFRSSNELEQIAHPRFWAAVLLNGPLQPVVGISWYEAAAYCRWLTLQGHTDSWLPTNNIIRLPTWHEWERAARHIDQRRHPWGDEPPHPERANYAATGLDAPSAIGCFPSGGAVCGAQDMLGNVCEWTASTWERWEDGQKDLTIQNPITLSLADFSTNELYCGARDWDSPGIWYVNGAFRIIQSLCSPNKASENRDTARNLIGASSKEHP